MNPEPGIYYDVPFSTYLKWPYPSKSSLSHFAVSPAQYQWNKAHPWKPSDAALRGSAADCLLFDGPDVFKTLFCCYAGRRDPRAKKYQDFLKANEGKTVLSKAIWDQVPEIVDSIISNKLAFPRISMGTSQVSMVWDDPLTGVRLKGRPDLVCEKRSECVDLKLTGDLGKFQRTAMDFRYHWQAAIYLDGLQANGVDVGSFSFIVCKAEPVYSVEVYKLTQRAIDLGRAEYKAALVKFAHCKKTNTWPKDSGEIQILDLPRWAYPREEKNESTKNV
jgi:hypothetical protein